MMEEEGTQQTPATGLSPRSSGALMNGRTSGASRVSSSRSRVSNTSRLSTSGDWRTGMQDNWDMVFNDQSPCIPFDYYLLCRRAKIITVEPVIFLYMFATYLHVSLLQEYYLWRFGAEKLRNSSFVFPNGSFCINDSLVKNEVGNKSYDEVNSESNSLVLYGNIANLIPSVVVALLLGPLSDRFGRRIVMVIVSIGSLVQGVLTILIMQYKLNMYLFILANFLSGISGDYAAILGVSFAYVSDVASKNWRTLRIGIVESMIFVSGAIGQLGNGVLLTKTHCAFIPPMFVYCACHVASILYIVIFLPESMSKEERLEKANLNPRGFRALLQGFKVFFYEGYSIWRLWLALIALSIVVVNMTGSQSIGIFFLSGSPLSWKADMIGYYQASSQLSHGLVLLVILPILVAAGLPDALTALIGICFSIGMDIFTGFVKATWQMFTISVVQAPEAVVSPAIRSLMSKLAAPKDQGALFTFVAAVEVFATVVASNVYNQVYPKTVEKGLHPGISYFLMATLFAIPVPLIILLLVFPKVRVPDEAPQTEEERALMTEAENYGSQNSTAPTTET